MARKTVTEQNANYASRKDFAIHTTVEKRLKQLFKREAAKAGMTEAQAARHSILEWLKSLKT